MSDSPVRVQSCRYITDGDCSKHRGCRGSHLRALSVDYFEKSFLHELTASSLPCTSKVYEIEEKVLRGERTQIVCPRDSRMGCAYVDCIPDDSGDAGCATVMLSYTWGYMVSDIAETLADFCQQQCLEASAVFVWMCCVCVNQHRVKEREFAGEVVPFHELQAAFATSVADIGHILAMMEPWNAPKYLTRVWCIFEIFMAVSDDACQVSILMPPRERLAITDMMLASGLGNDLDGFFKVLADIDVTQAEASYESDRLHILQLIEDKCGAAKVNEKVGQYVRDWMASSTAFTLSTLMSTGALGDDVAVSLCMNIGWMLRQIKQTTQALALFHHALHLMEKLGTLESPAGAMLLCNIGIVQEDQQELTSALETLHRAKQIRETIGELETEDGAALLKVIGSVTRVQGNIAAALEFLDLAKRIREHTGSLNTSGGASLLKATGDCRLSSGDMSGAIAIYLEAKAIRNANHSLATPAGAELLAALGTAYERFGSLKLAHATYTEALAVEARISDSSSPFHRQLDISIKRIEAETIGER